MIIGINGEIGHGKDTLGMILQALTMHKKYNVEDWLNDPIGYTIHYKNRPNLCGGWKIVKFADKLKETVSLLTGIPREKLEDPEIKKSKLGPEWDNRTVRQFMLDLGDCTRNGLHINTWINALMPDYKPENTVWGYPTWIITDMRMPNEFKAVEDHGGITVRINRPGAEDSGISHATESALKDYKFTYEVENTTLEGLVEQAKDILKNLE